MRISAEGKIGLWVGVIGVAGAGALAVAPAPYGPIIGWTLLSIATLGAVGLSHHHLCELIGLEWKFGNRRKMIALAGMIACGVGLLGFTGAYFFGSSLSRQLASAASPPPAQTTPLTPPPTSDVPRQSPVVFLRNMQVSGPYEGDNVVRLIGFANVTTDRLRVFVDYADSLRTQLGKRRIEVGQLNDVVRDTQIIYPIVFKKVSPSYASYYFIGDGPNNPINTGPSRMRVVVIGQNDEEQYYVFSLYSADGHVDITPSTRVDNPKFLIRDDSSTPW